MSSDFWLGKRVLITGHTGFKGGWLTLWLRMLGAKVYGLALPPESDPSLYAAADIGRGIDTEIADINQYSSVLRYVDAVSPEIVFHLAAQPLVRLSYERPLETLSTNIMGTANLLEAIREVDSVASIVVVTSDKCYENREWVWGYRENEPMGGYDPYSASKGSAELVVNAYRQAFFDSRTTKVATARAGNVHGGGDWSLDRVVPDLVKAFTEKRSAIIRRPNATRPWQHVLEPLYGYLLLAERLCDPGDDYSGGWNFGPDIAGERSVGELADQLTKCWGGDAQWIHVAEEGALHEAHYLKLDSSKARTQLGWIPKWDFGQGIVETVKWYREFYYGTDVRALSEDQIERYLSH